MAAAESQLFLIKDPATGECAAIAVFDVIYVESVRCVVTRVREVGHPFGECEVLFNLSKPTTHDVEWREGKWRFATRGDYGGYANGPDYAAFISRLRDLR